MGAGMQKWHYFKNQRSLCEKWVFTGKNQTVYSERQLFPDGLERQDRDEFCNKCVGVLQR